MKKEDFLKLGLDEETATKCANASTEELKAYIPKTRFDEVNTEKKNLETSKTTLEGQLETLKNSTGDVETLKKQITDLQTANQTKDTEHAAEIKKLKVDSIINEALTKAGAKNLKAARVLLDIDPETAELSEDGSSIKGLDDKLKTVTEAEETKFMFNAATAPKKPEFKGLVPGEKKDGVPGETKANSLADAIKLHYSSDTQ